MATFLVALFPIPTIIWYMLFVVIYSVHYSKTEKQHKFKLFTMELEHRPILVFFCCCCCWK